MGMSDGLECAVGVVLFCLALKSVSSRRNLCLWIECFAASNATIQVGDPDPNHPQTGSKQNKSGWIGRGRIWRRRVMALGTVCQCFDCLKDNCQVMSLLLPDLKSHISLTALTGNVCTLCSANTTSNIIYKW